MGLEFRQKEKVTFLHAWSIDSADHQYELKEKDFGERGTTEYELYNDYRIRSAIVPAANPGTVIAFEYEIHRHPFLNHLNEYLQDSIPIHELHVSLELPHGWEYKDYWAGVPRVAPVAGKGDSAEWVLHDMPAVRDDEEMSPPPWALAGRLELSYLQPGELTRNTASWEQLGKWDDQLAAGRRNPSPELAEKARQLTAGKADFDGKLRALASFMQSDIRYVAIEIGIGSVQPHAAADVFRSRYGDCKDKATLLSSMLHEVGIESDYVDISTERSTVNPLVPSPRFNHQILAVELLPGTNTPQYQSAVKSKSGKSYLIFDPTDSYTPLGSLRGELQDSYALLVADGRGELIHTPLLDPDTNSLVRSGHFTLSSDGSLTGEVEEDRSGDHAFHERIALQHANQQQRTQRIERRLSHSLKGFTLEKSDIQKLDEIQQKLVISLALTSPAYGQVRGPLMLVRPRVLGEAGFPLDRKPRLYPFQFDGTSRQSDTFEIELPKDYAVEDVPDPVNLDAGFATYRSKVEVEGSKLRYSREYVRRDVLIGAEHTEELRKFLGVIGADEMAVVVLKHIQ